MSGQVLPALERLPADATFYPTWILQRCALVAADRALREDRLAYGFRSQDDLVGLAGGAGILTTTRVSAAKQGMKPIIVPNMKHQVVSIAVCPLLI
jgi:hypothetical protein